MNINKIIIWGHELHDHTHSYIHNGFYKGFKHIGYNTHWLSDTKENSLKMDFHNSLFIVHGLVCKYLPINKNSIYLLHNVSVITNSYGKSIIKSAEDKTEIPRKNIINLQVYTKDCLFRDIKDKNYKCHYFLEPPHQIIYFPWATDLLPFEIDQSIRKLDSLNSNKEINFVGMISECWNSIKEYCINNDIQFNHYGGTFQVDSNRNKSIKEHKELIQKSIIAPCIQSEWQLDVNYIPCRIFKNISYGKMGVTNSKAVYDFFDQKIIYSENITELMDKAIEFEKNPNKNVIIKELMKEIRDNHTYINRCNYILDYLNKFFDIKINT